MSLFRKLNRISRSKDQGFCSEKLGEMMVPFTEVKQGKRGNRVKFEKGLSFWDVVHLRYPKNVN